MKYSEMCYGETMSINEVFTFTGFGKILLGPGNLYSEKLHSTASTLNERPSTQEVMGEYYG